MPKVDKYIIESCLEKRVNGADYSEIRKDLSRSGYTFEQVKSIISEVDELFIQNEFHSKKGKLVYKTPQIVKANIKIWGGVLLFLGGSFFSAYTLMNPEATGYYIVLYGPVLSGLALYASGRKDLRKLDQSVDRMSKSFFRTNWRG